MESRYFSGFFCFIGTSSCPDCRNGQEHEPITDINGKLLDAFYGEARRLGDDLESFKKTLERVDLEEHVGDDWIRSNDSRLFGPLPADKIEGKVVGVTGSPLS
ncbi:hypothetical protein [Paenibacillus cellulositrophicus]|uniref:hypothetical protein n=1 Tax=Paenibacillus cellulositrophicus TaxID=562959 RepID=UPI003D973ED9